MVSVQEVTCPQRRLLKTSTQDIEHPYVPAFTLGIPGNVREHSWCNPYLWEIYGKVPFQIKAHGLQESQQIPEWGSSNFSLYGVLWISVAGSEKVYRRTLLEIQAGWLLGGEGRFPTVLSITASFSSRGDHGLTHKVWTKCLFCLKISIKSGETIT